MDGGKGVFTYLSFGDVAGRGPKSLYEDKTAS